ncbi:type IV pilin [Halovenus salina]|uniref:Type IV pilin n=1 Tax=Halovenus salina TaxID=1510225 RepID=A0ABD5W4E0_9EURY
MDGSDRGISPVISTILLVAVVVILAATISVPVLGLGENINDPAPSAALEVSETESETVELAHIAGNTIEGDNLEIRGGEIIETEMPETIEAGTTIEIDPAPDVDDITVTWEGKEQSAVLLQESVSAGLGGDGAIGAGDILILQTEDGEPQRWGTRTIQRLIW